MEGILIGTAILWLLTALFVVPLTNWSVARRMEAEGVSITAIEELPEDDKRRWEAIATGYYILWDVLVLGIAGFIGGLLGYFFIGISLEAKGWPGMLAFIGASLLGLTLSSAAAPMRF